MLLKALKEEKVIVSFRKKHINKVSMYIETASVVKWSEFLAAGPEVAVSIPGTTRFSE
jgi:hypothetical protein